MTISPQVHRAIYFYAVKRWLDENEIDSNKIAEENGIDVKDRLGYHQVLDIVQDQKMVSSSKLDEFLLEQLYFGNMRHIYVVFLEPSQTSHLNIEQKILSCVRELEKHGYKNSIDVQGSGFVKDLRRAVPRGESKLIHFEYDSSSPDKISRIRFLLSEGIMAEDGEVVNYYIPVEIDLENNLLTIRLWNFKSDTEDSVSLDDNYRQVLKIICECFGLVALKTFRKNQQIVHKMITDLTGRVLKPTIEEVDKKLAGPVGDKIKEWCKDIIEDELPAANISIIKDTLLHHMYKIYMLKKYGKLTKKQLRAKGILGYPRYVKFVDDTVGEGRAKSSDPNESLLDTSVFYDIKARMDQARQIKLATIYWLDCGEHERFGTSIYTDVQDRFKIIVLPNHFKKEDYYYVLREVVKYSK